jgi:putative aminophosphonate oxidoreductase
MKSPCYWITQALAEDDAVSPALEGEHKADVCIVGGGYLGLWTAIRLKQDDPKLDVALIEQNFCGSGPSGRNGGYALSWWPKYETLKKICGTAEAIRLCQASAEAVDEIGRFCATHGIDAEYRRDGWLWLSSCAAHDGGWTSIMDGLERRQIHPFERLMPDEASARAHSRAKVTGVFEPVSATVQPAKLARGLRRVAIDLGVRLFENTPMTRLVRSHPPVVETPRGRIVAGKVTLAMNAWAAQFAEIRKAVVVIGSDVMMTEPIPERLAEIGYTDGMSISDSRMLVSGWRNTPDGRLLTGRGGVSCLHAFGGRVGTIFDGRSTQEAGMREVRNLLYPELDDAPLATSWNGPVDRSKSGLPFFGRLGGHRDIVFGVGFSGNGVGPTRMCSRILCSLIGDTQDEWSRSGLVRPLTHDFPPEPIRHLGIGLVRKAVIAKENAELAGRKPGAIANFFAGFAPNMLASSQAVED